MSFFALPQNKADDFLVEKLYDVDSIILKDSIHDLLEWMKDPNWPVARAIKELLPKKFGKEILIPLKNILDNSEDNQWIFSCLLMLKMFPFEVVSELKDDLQRYAFEPNIKDVMELNHEIALDLLKEFWPHEGQASQEALAFRKNLIEELSRTSSKYEIIMIEKSEFYKNTGLFQFNGNIKRNIRMKFIVLNNNKIIYDLFRSVELNFNGLVGEADSVIGEAMGKNLLESSQIVSDALREYFSNH